MEKYNIKRGIKKEKIKGNERNIKKRLWRKTERKIN